MRPASDLVWATSEAQAVSQTNPMTPAELIALSSQQQEIAEYREVRVHGSQLTELIKRRSPMLMSELLSHPDQRTEMRRFRYGHILGRGCSDIAIAEWQQRRDVRLASDVTCLLRQIDGIHLWADLDNGRGYYGILPLVEWHNVHESESAPLFEDLGRKTFVISYHENGDYFLLLDTITSEFTWFDPQSPTDSVAIGTRVEALLDWWWERVQELDPRAT
jgi:hypothetical protein